MVGDGDGGGDGDGDVNTERKIKMARAEGKSKTKRRKIGSCDFGTTESCIASFIPEEVVYGILLCVPADVLLNVMRHVCRLWYNIIRSPAFISSHHQKLTTSGVLFQKCTSTVSGYFVEPTKCNIEVRELKFQFPGVVVGSCNGLVLIFDYSKVKGTIFERSGTLYVANPVIKQRVVLPVAGKLRFYGFAYADSSRVYKVVDYNCEHRKCRILTVGVDKMWRPLDIVTSIHASKFSSPVSVGGFVHWVSSKIQCVLSLDIETEWSQKISLPPGCKNHRLKLLAMGSSLTIIAHKRSLWQVWLLKDPNIGIWTKLYDINIENNRSFPELHCLAYGKCPDHLGFRQTFVHFGYYSLRPLCWLQGGEVLVFQVSDKTNWIDKKKEKTKWIVYNVKTRGAHIFESDSIKDENLICHAHVNSLLPLNKFLLH